MGGKARSDSMQGSLRLRSVTAWCFNKPCSVDPSWTTSAMLLKSRQAREELQEEAASTMHESLSRRVLEASQSAERLEKGRDGRGLSAAAESGKVELDELRRGAEAGGNCFEINEFCVAVAFADGKVAQPAERGGGEEAENRFEHSHGRIGAQGERFEAVKGRECRSVGFDDEEGLVGVVVRPRRGIVEHESAHEATLRWSDFGGRSDDGTEVVCLSRVSVENQVKLASAIRRVRSLKLTRQRIGSVSRWSSRLVVLSTTRV